MAKTNLKVSASPVFTHEGAKASHINAEQQLRRSLMACMLWEKEFYEDGQTIAERIASLIPQVVPGNVATMAIEARSQMHLRHAPLLVLREMARLPKHQLLVGTTLPMVIQRADELSEFVSLYWKDGRQSLSAQVKKGLSAALRKFDGYALAKYNRDATVKLRDVLFLCHAKPKDAEQAALWKQLVDGTLATPDTWEVALSGGKDKKETWERLMSERKLGGLAFLRNLRNMQTAGVSLPTIQQGLRGVNVSQVLPFRFIAAARYAPQLEPDLEAALFRSLAGKAKFTGSTMVLVDVSGSMKDKLSEKSDMTRMDAACGVAMCARELGEPVRVFTFSDALVEIPARRGFALRDAITSSQPHSGTHLGGAVTHLNTLDYDRLVVVTDEQSADSVPPPKGKGYVINVASAKNGVGYGAWHHIDGWSEAVLDYIRENEGAVSQDQTDAQREADEE